MQSVDLTNAAYDRWLRAQRPPLEFFLAQDVAVQEQLAAMGDEYVRRMALDLAYCIRDPERVEAVLSQDESEVERIAIERMAKGVLVAAMQELQQPPPPPTSTQPGVPESMAGFQHRKEAAARSKVDPGLTTLLGKTPDKIKL